MGRPRREEFIQVELRLWHDPRFLTLSAENRYCYLGLIAFAKGTNNKIPKNCTSIRTFLRLDCTDAEMQMRLDCIKRAFPKFRSTKHYYFFDGYGERYVNRAPLPYRDACGKWIPFSATVAVPGRVLRAPDSNNSPNSFKEQSVGQRDSNNSPNSEPVIVDSTPAEARGKEDAIINLLAEKYRLLHGLNAPDTVRRWLDGAIRKRRIGADIVEKAITDPPHGREITEIIRGLYAEVEKDSKDKPKWLS